MLYNKDRHQDDPKTITLVPGMMCKNDPMFFSVHGSGQVQNILVEAVYCWKFNLPSLKTNRQPAHSSRLYKLSDGLLTQEVGKIIKIEPFISQATVFKLHSTQNF